MADLTFFYGTMESGKTTKLLQDNHNYLKHGHKVVIVKPAIDLKGGNTVVARNSTAAEVDIMLSATDSMLDKDNLKVFRDAKVILVDEAQFLQENQVRELWLIAHKLNISVVAYGLKSDFLGIPFDGTRILIGYADKKHELTVNCLCGAEAVFNARMVDGKFTLDGDTVAIDGFHDVSYIPLCSDCYLEKVVAKEDSPIIKTLKKLEKIK